MQKLIQKDPRITVEAQQLIANLMGKGMRMRDAKRKIGFTEKKPLSIGSYKKKA